MEHPTVHAALGNIAIDQHHIRPSNIEFTDTTSIVPPLPGGPKQIDISVPYAAKAVLFSLQGGLSIAEGGAKPGVIGVATRTYSGATCASLGGQTATVLTAYCAIYSGPGGALNLSHKIFTVAGRYVSLSLAYLPATGPSTRVLRLEFTNYGASNYTLWCKGEIQVLG